MSKVYMICGVQGSGKSYYSKILMQKTGATYFSSDEIRAELTEKKHTKEEHQVVFDTLLGRMAKELSFGRDVIYDATNVSRKKRIHFINNVVKGHEVIAHVMVAPLELCLERNRQRERKEPDEVILRTYKNFQLPMKFEGFSSVNYHVIGISSVPVKEEFEELFSINISYKELFGFLNKMIEFKKIHELAQDSSYHSFSVSRHTYYVYRNVLENYAGEHRLEMFYASVFHDIGKGYCKSFLNYKGEETRYANFMGHENVSSQIAFTYLTLMGYAEEFVERVVELVAFHMLPKKASVKGMKKVEDWMTSKEQYENLLLFNNYDDSSK